MVETWEAIFIDLEATMEVVRWKGISGQIDHQQFTRRPLPAKHEEFIIDYQLILEPFCPQLILDFCHVGSFGVDPGGTLLD